jgi:transposase
MSNDLQITTERVDDIPLLMGQLSHMGVAPILDEFFPTHGHWGGLSLGETTQVWLSHILSQADHRLNVVQEWAATRLTTLSRLLDKPMRALDVSDDRLAAILHALSDDTRWAACESRLNARLVRVYALRPQRVFVDSTTSSGYWHVSEAGLFQFGHSKDHRPDLPQVKVMLGVLDPLGLPVATHVVSGEQADDRLYLPVIERIRTSLDQPGLLYVGDCKMSALATRARLAQTGDYYLCPWANAALRAADLTEYVAWATAHDSPPQPIDRVAADGSRTRIAEGYEWHETLTTTLDEQPVEWTERRLLVRSLAAAASATAALQRRLAEAQTAIADLTRRGHGRRRLRDVTSAQAAVAAIERRLDVVGLLAVTISLSQTPIPKRRYRAQAARVEYAAQVTIQTRLDETAVAAAEASLGWRLYVTNHTAEDLPLATAVLAYREAYQVEHGLGRLKGQPLSLRPMYLARDDHATGLIRLLSLALRVLTLLEFVVRRRLAQSQASLSGLYAGQPTRATARPTAEQLLRAFGDLTLTLIQTPTATLRHMPPLSALQQQILTLLDLPADLYACLAVQSLQPP